MKESSTTFWQKGWVVCLGACISCFLWGSAFPCIKIGYQMFHVDSADTSSQLLFAGIRFFLAGVLVLAFAAVSRRSLRLAPSVRRDTTPEHPWWGYVIGLSFFQTIAQYFFFYIGMAHTSGVKGSIIEGANVFVAILTVCLVFRMETLTPAKFSGCLVGFAGVILVNLSGARLEGGFHLTGEGFVFLSTIAYALSSVTMKKITHRADPVLLSGWQFLFGGFVLALIGLLSGGHIRPDRLTGLVLLLYMAFISAGAYTLWGVLLKYNPVSRVNIYGFMNPVFGVILSCLLLRNSSQTPGITSLIALALVCLGICLVNRPKTQDA